MFIALDSNKNRVSIENAEKGVQYFCPICGEPLIIRAKDSVAVKPHFAHKKGTDCDDFSHDMSEWHLNWQRQFPEECREVVVENQEEKHRADVLVNKTVIEFQHSPISAEEIARRNKFYISCGYKMIWVFDAENQIKNQYDETLDPARCREFDLCWKRAKQQFSIPMDSSVSVFIHYKTKLSIPELKGQQIDILLLLKGVEPKDIRYYSTQVGTKYYYLTPRNLVKEFITSLDENTAPVSLIVNEAIKYQRQVQQQINARQRVVYVPIRGGRGRRRF